MDTPDFIQNLGKQKQEYENTPINSNIPDFIQQPKLQSNTVTPNIKDIEVTNELGFDLDTTLENDEQAAQDYVNNLSDDDYKTWRNLRKEGYSISAAKTLLENQDLLYDISKPGANKYMSNKPSMMGNLTNLVQKYNIGYEQVIHPRTESIQDSFDQAGNRLEEKLGKENLMNRWIEKNNPYGKLSPKLAESSINTTERFVNMAQMPKVGGEILLSLGKSGVNAIDQWLNRVGIIAGEGINQISEGNPIQINYGEDRSNLLGSYIQSAADVMGAGLTVSYPIVTYIFSMLGATQTDRNTLMERVDGGFDKVIGKFLELDVIENWMDNNLNQADQEALKEDIKYALYRAGAQLLGWGGKKISRSEAVKNFETVSKMVDSYGKRNANLEMQKNYNLRRAASQEPVGTEVLNEKGKPIARSTPEGAEFTPYGSADTLIAGGKGYIKGAGEAIASYLKNRNRQILPRDPNAPVGELPEIGVNKPVGETTPTQEESTVVEDVVPESTKIKKKSKTVIKTADKTTGEGIGSFIKRVTNEISGKQGGLDSNLMEKLKTSKDLQNEFVNTIDPYLKSGGVENPSGVISEQLADLVDSARVALETKRENNTTFRSGQRKYGVQITESEKLTQKNEDLQIKELIKLLSRPQDDPEVFLRYLMKLPKEKVNYMNQIFPDFTQNLQLIKDTLDVTKAISKPDIVDRFLSYKSGFGTRKSFIKKLLYQYLKEKYRKNGIQTNLKEIETIINNMSEEQIKELEKDLQDSNIRAWTDEQKANYNEKGYMLNTYEKVMQNLDDFMNSKWYGTNKTVREYLEEKQVPLSITTPEFVDRMTRGFNLRGGLAAYNGELDRILLPTILTYEGMVFHEFGHRLLNQLGTVQIMDMITYISKRDKISANAAFERWAEYFRNYMRTNNIDGKKYLIKNFGEDIASKIEGVTQRIKEEVWDLFDIEDETELKINQIMSDVKHDTPAGKDITSRRPEPITEPMIGNREPVRYEWLRSWDDNVASVRTNPSFDQQLEVVFKDGSSKKWSEYKKGLSQEQLNEMDTYRDDYLSDWVESELKRLGKGRKFGFKGEGEFDYKTLKNEKDLTSLIMDEIDKSLKITKEDLGLDYFEGGELLKTLKDIYPDIIGIGEKNGRPSVKILEESFWERWEMADRPGMREIREIEMKDFFTPSEIEQLPKDLQELIKKDAD